MICKKEKRRCRVGRQNRWLKRTLTEAAHGASHTKDTHLASQYHRLSGRRGKKRAVVAVSHGILVSAHYILKRQQACPDLGSNYFDQLHRERFQRHLIRRLETLGYKVSLEPLPQAA